MDSKASTIFHSKGNNDIRATRDSGDRLGIHPIRIKLAVLCLLCYISRDGGDLREIGVAVDLRYQRVYHEVPAFGKQMS